MAVPVFPHRNPLALAAYYLGLFALIPDLGIVLGPIAVALGAGGLRRVRRDPAVQGRGHAWAGLLTGATGLVVWGGQALGWWALPIPSVRSLFA